MKKIGKTSLRKFRLPVLLACLVAASVSAASGPTNSWSDWSYKKLVCGFTNALLVTLNGHTLPAFATDLFDDETHLYLYGDMDGDVYGAGDISLKTGDREAVFNVEAEGALDTRGGKPYLSFKLSGEGSGTVGDEAGEAELEAKFVQTNFLAISPGGALPETYYSEGRITGTIKQEGADALKFEDNIRIPLDNVPGHFGDILAGPQLKLDIVKLSARRFAGHAHGTNNCFGRYEGDPDDVLAKGMYRASTGELSADLRGVGPGRNIKATVTGQLDSAPPNDMIHVSDVTMKVKAYGQKTVWTGNGIAYQTEP